MTVELIEKTKYGLIFKTMSEWVVRIRNLLDDRLSQSWVTKIKNFLKLFVTVGFLSYLWKVVPFAQLHERFSSLSLLTVFAIFVTVLCYEFFTTLSLWALLRKKTDASLKDAVVVDAMSMVVNSVIPTKAGALVSLPLFLKRRLNIEINFGFALITVQFALMSTIHGSITLFGTILLLLQFTSEFFGVFFISATLYLGFALLAAVTFVFGGYMPKSLLQYLPDRITEVRNVSIPQRSVLESGLFQFGAVLCFCVRFYIVAQAFDVSLPEYYYFFLPITIYSVTAVPISFAGIGVVETAGILTLTLLGVSSGDASSIIILDRVLNTYLPLVGSSIIAGFLWLRK